MREENRKLADSKKPKYRCLIVDDEESIAQMTCEYFNMFDISSYYVLNYQACLEFLLEYRVSLILLDINLGGQSGFELCKKIRKSTDIPIFFISARTSDEDILTALHIGGDDYIKKPYSLTILLAKVKAALRRQENPGFHPCEPKNSGPIVLDYNYHQVTVEGEPRKLKEMEFKLLCFLMEHAGCVVTKEEIFQQVWGDHFVGDGTLSVHIRHLRQKIEKDGSICGKVIVTANIPFMLHQTRKTGTVIFLILFFFFTILGGVYTYYLYKNILKPFGEMKQVAEKISCGNFDVPLIIDKNHIFGAFTESFDLMREQLLLARKREAMANQNRKELVASLSHDMKTPITSIQLISELLLELIKEEKIKQKIAAINQKAQQIDVLITNLFHTTLEDLEHLTVAPAELYSSQLKPIIMYYIIPINMQTRPSGLRLPCLRPI